MASVFKTKVAMLDIIKNFANELTQIGFVVNVPRLNNDEGQQNFYIDNEFDGDIYFHYQKENRSMRRIVPGLITMLKSIITLYTMQIKLKKNITLNCVIVKHDM